MAASSSSASSSSFFPCDWPLPKNSEKKSSCCCSSALEDPFQTRQINGISPVIGTIELNTNGTIKRLDTIALSILGGRRKRDIEGNSIETFFPYNSLIDSKMHLYSVGGFSCFLTSRQQNTLAVCIRPFQFLSNNHQFEIRLISISKLLKQIASKYQETLNRTYPVTLLQVDREGSITTIDYSHKNRLRSCSNLLNIFSGIGKVFVKNMLQSKEPSIFIGSQIHAKSRSFEEKTFEILMVDSVPNTKQKRIVLLERPEDEQQ